MKGLARNTCTSVSYIDICQHNPGVENMKIPRSLIAIAALALLPGIVAAHGTRRFEGGLWWTGTGFEARTFYAVDGILRVSWDGSVDEVVDLEGRFIVPPLA